MTRRMSEVKYIPMRWIVFAAVLILALAVSMTCYYRKPASTAPAVVVVS